MARPWKHPKTGVWWFRGRAPADVLTRVKGTKLMIPVPWQGTGEARPVTVGAEVKVTLSTKDDGEARLRFREVDLFVSRHWQRVREGRPVPNQRQAEGLAGVLYAEVRALYADDPGDPNDRAAERAHLAEALDGGDAAAFETWAADILRRHSYALDEKAEPVVRAAMAQAADLALAAAERNAAGDWRPDPAQARFPPPEAAPARSTRAVSKPAPSPPTRNATAEAWATLLAAYRAENLDLRPKTLDGREAMVGTFARSLDGRGPDEATPEDALAWKDALVAEGLTKQTITNKLTGVRTVFDWAHANRRVSANPFLGVKVSRRRGPKPKRRGFTEQEAAAILAAALRWEPRTGSETRLDLARRWVPWLGAFTGARVAELAQLRKQDVAPVGDDGGPCITITPEAGTTKNRQARTVPVHRQLVALGFLAFVASRPDGPLFYDPADVKPDAKQTPAESVAQRLRLFVREDAGVIADDVDPTHGWRHRFSTLGRKHHMDFEKRETILGHAVPGEASTYGEAAGLREEVEKLPEWDVDALRAMPAPAREGRRKSSRAGWRKGKQARAAKGEGAPATPRPG